MTLVGVSLGRTEGSLLPRRGTDQKHLKSSGDIPDGVNNDINQKNTLENKKKRKRKKKCEKKETIKKVFFSFFFSKVHSFIKTNRVVHLKMTSSVLNKKEKSWQNGR